MSIYWSDIMIYKSQKNRMRLFTVLFDLNILNDYIIAGLELI